MESSTKEVGLRPVFLQSIRHCRCHWIMAAWFVFLHFFLVPLCWYVVSERQMLLFFSEGLVGVEKHLFQRVSLITSMTISLNYIFVLLLTNVDIIPKQKQLRKTRRKISSMSQSTASHLLARTSSSHRPTFIRPGENHLATLLSWRQSGGV